MKPINESELLSTAIVEKINNFLIKNSFNEKIRIAQKTITATDGSYCLQYERYFIIGSDNQRIYLDTLKDVVDELLDLNILKTIIEKY